MHIYMSIVRYLHFFLEIEKREKKKKKKKKKKEKILIINVIYIKFYNNII